MIRARPGPKQPPAPIRESPERSKIPRAQLWAVVDAAPVYYRRATEGRRDTIFFDRAAEDLEKALGGLPDETWRRR
jgi:hypothetical protein